MFLARATGWPRVREGDGELGVPVSPGASRMFGQRELNNAFAPLDFLPERLIPLPGQRV